MINSEQEKIHKSSFYNKVFRRVEKNIFDNRLLIDKTINSKRSTAVKFYYRPDFKINFGDLLTPVILRKFGVIPIPALVDFTSVCVGSLLEEIDSKYKGYIIGSGLIYEKRKSFDNAIILAVRGKLTQELIGAPNNIVLGDPGLLVSYLIKKSPKKRFEVGLVPHYVDKLDKRLFRIIDRFPGQVKIIDVQRGPLSVLREIDQCRYILSSSLHGLVSADSLGIPNAWIELSDKVYGSGFKFHDYASAFDCEIKSNYLSGDEDINMLVQMTHQVSPNVELVKAQLSDLFVRFRELVVHNNLSMKR